MLTVFSAAFAEGDPKPSLPEYDVWVGAHSVVFHVNDLPEGATLAWTYGWPSTLDAPENEGDAPTGVKATIAGSAPRTFLLIW